MRAFFSALMVLAVGSATAADFSGWEITGAVTNEALTATGNGFDNAGHSTGFAAATTKQNETGFKLGTGYGFRVHNFLTTLGGSYSHNPNNLVIDVTGVNASNLGGPISMKTQDRLDLFVAPGFLLLPTSQIYVKAGYSYAPLKSLSDISGGTALSGGPGSGGFLLGLGWKERVSPNSPLFFQADYTLGQSRAGSVQDASGDQYETRLRNSTLSLGFGYLFH